MLAIFLYSKHLNPKGYEVAKGIYIGMDRDKALKLLDSKFDIYTTDDDNDISIYGGGDKNRDAFEYFGVDGIWAITLKFDNNNSLVEVWYSGSGDYDSFENWCAELGQYGVNKNSHGSWYKGHADLSDDVVLLIGYCYSDPDHTGYSASIILKDAAKDRVDYYNYY